LMMMIPRNPILLHSIKCTAVLRPLGLHLFLNRRIHLLVNARNVLAASCAGFLSVHRSQGRSQALATTTKYRLYPRTRRYPIVPPIEIPLRMGGTVLRGSPLGGRHLQWGNASSRVILMASIEVDQRASGLYRTLLSQFER
jgi:hypothetical protein